MGTKSFASLKSGYEITFVGHSKGGAAAAAAAVATNKNAILFNPANTNLSDYGLNGSTYTGSMTQYVVIGEILSNLGIGPVRESQIPSIKTVALKRQSIWNSITNHQMPAVKKH